MQGRQRLVWPVGLAVTPIREKWFERISRLPPGLDLSRAARRLRQPYGAARRWAVRFGYEFPDRRRVVAKKQWARVDWSQRDAVIARELGVTRECVRLVRKAKGIGPSAVQAATRQLDFFVSSHRKCLHGMLVEDVIRYSGTDLPYHVVRRILREHGVRPHEPSSPLRHMNWRLPNRDLAEIWQTSSRYIANLRARLQVGPARWGAGRAAKTDPRYRAAIQRERKTAGLYRAAKSHATENSRASAAVSRALARLTRR